MSDNSPLSSQRQIQYGGFESRLFEIQKDQNNKTKFDKLLSRALGFWPDWSIELSDQGSYFLKFNTKNGYHTSDGLGEGIISVFAIIDSLYDAESGSVVAIDEPELSLHPALQKRISKILNEYSANSQIIISTHSPYIVDIDSIVNGAGLIRVSRGIEENAVNKLDSNARESLKKVSQGNIFNPHIMGVVGREIFFQEDGVIITEGQEDVILYPEICAQIGFNEELKFFGWGAGGANNIKHVCTILRSLGFNKISSILDNDKEHLIKELEEEFPSYYFTNIPAKDIRTKEHSGVDGLLDKNLKIRPEYIGKTKEIFNMIHKYMESH